REEVSTRFPGIRQQLKDAVERWKTEQQVGIQRPKRPFTVGDSDHHQTLLPVRDAQTTGKISRSNRFPNDAYLTGWTQASDLIQWPVEVRHEGLYEVRLWYTCAPENLNSLLELSFGGEKIRARVDEAWNPALQGAEQDRVPRQESLIKPFKPFPMGYLYLHKTSGDLRLKALDIPGSSAPDIRLLELKYVQNP
ncbi:MAG: N-acetylgalactosamine 6-sulfate sulfatase, partial [Limisphaerales bacterium]